MRKFSFLAILFASVISFSSCSKEAIQPAGPNTTTENPNNATVSYSAWIPSSIIYWQDTTIDGSPMIHTTLSAQLSEAMVNNNSVLVYARKMNNEAVHTFPVLFYDTNEDYEALYSVNSLGGIQIFHSKSVGGQMTRPEYGNMEFRYVLIEQPVPANGRPDMTGAPQYNISELQQMSYQDAMAALGIPE